MTTTTEDLARGHLRALTILQAVPERSRPQGIIGAPGALGRFYTDAERREYTSGAHARLIAAADRLTKAMQCLALNIEDVYPSIVQCEAELIEAARDFEGVAV